MCAPVSGKEVGDGLKSIGNDKAPSIDGYNAHFVKKAWPIFKEDVIMPVTGFFNTGLLPRTVNCTTIILVPKLANVITVKDFRPIASLFLKHKLALFLEISDNIIMAQELVKPYMKKHISVRCMIKIDLQKAYDLVAWPFLGQVMDELGFPTQFTAWIMECVRTGDLQSIIAIHKAFKVFSEASGL
ncbi:uncharacterized protein LOC132038488 [Lycium ferocissimum]|uniref:uncharacterized protein LOC132038488 n=1 Tax=Lycium ferocissimum TaxID=112874 RepID=UPI0028165CFF|nr:uncharacterized protein LOC132038488 [Lycium ferocissimum]